MKRKMTAGLLALLVVVLGGLVYMGNVIAAATLTANWNLEVSQVYSNVLDLSTVSSAQPYKKSLAFSSGTGANQADRIFTDTRTIAASTTEDLDIRGTSLQDAFGANVAMFELKMLIVCAASGNTNNVVLGGDANSVPFLSTAATTVSIKPGGCFALMDPSAGGVTVTDTTGDIIQVANSGGGTTVSYDIVVIGSSS